MTSPLSDAEIAAMVKRLRHWQGLNALAMAILCNDSADMLDNIAAELRAARTALRPFVAYLEALNADRMHDQVGVATEQRRPEPDISINLGHLRAARACLPDGETG